MDSSETIQQTIPFIYSNHWIFPMMQVLLLFSIYVAVIIYMSLYDSSNIPNFRTIINFLFDSQSMADINIFNTYLQTHSTTTTTPTTKESFITIPDDIKEKYGIQNNCKKITGKLSNFTTYITQKFNSLFVKTYVDGKTVRITHR